MTDILAPLEQEGTKAVVRQWLKKLGDLVAVDDPIVELETDKVSVEVPSPGAGVLLEILLEADAEAAPGAVLGRLGLSDASVPSSVPASPRPDASPTPVSASAAPHLSPAVRRAVLETGLDPSGIAGSGRGGRITRADVDKAAAERSRGAPGPTPASTGSVVPSPLVPRDVDPAPSTPSLAAAPVPEKVRSVPHDRMRRTIAENMLNSVTVAPHVTAIFEADFTAIMAHRRKHKAAFEREGANLTFTAYIVQACVAAMRAAPSVNSRWYDDRLEIYEDISIGVGTALADKGLIVPVLHRTQDLSLLGVATRLTLMVAKARNGRLSGEDVRGGTFTISNHGVSGSLFASPIIIAQPQSAILGVGKLEKRVVVREVDGVDTIQIRPMAYVSLTIDHRVLDGHQTNTWLSAFVEHLERWPADVS